MERSQGMFSVYHYFKKIFFKRGESVRGCEVWKKGENKEKENSEIRKRMKQRARV